MCMFEWMISLNHHRGTAILRAIEMSREADNKTDLAPSSRILQSLTFKPADQTAGTCQVSILSRRDSTSSNLSDIREHTASDLPYHHERMSLTSTGRPGTTTPTGRCSLSTISSRSVSMPSRSWMVTRATALSLWRSSYLIDRPRIGIMINGTGDRLAPDPSLASTAREPCAVTLRPFRA